MTQSPPPSSKRRLGIIAAAVIALSGAYAGITKFAVEQQERPEYLATALYGPDDPRGDTNIVVYKDRVVETAPVFDKDGHASLPKWEATRGPLPHWTIPAVSIMGWNPPYIADVASGRRPLYYCVDEARQFDARYGTQITPLMQGGLREMWDDLFEGVSSVEDCSRPDFVMGASAAQDCKSTGAYGCAAFDGRKTRVTFNGELRASGQMSDDAIKFSLLFHEGKHALDFAHCGIYGNEGTNHAHLCDMGYVGAGGRPVDNQTGKVAVEDYENPAGGYRYGLQRRGIDPTPSPTPRTTTTPTPRPTPSPSPRLGVPTGLTASAITATGFTLRWNAVNGAAEYQLCVIASGEGACNDVPRAPTATAVITGRKPATLYFAWVAACNGGVCSGWSEGVSVQTPAAPTPTPSPTPSPTPKPASSVMFLQRWQHESAGACPVALSGQWCIEQANSLGEVRGPEPAGMWLVTVQRFSDGRLDYGKGFIRYEP